MAERTSYHTCKTPLSTKKTAYDATFEGSEEEEQGASGTPFGRVDSNGIFPCVMTLRNAYAVNSMLGLYLFFTYKTEIGFGSTTEPTEDDMNVNIGECEDPNKYIITIDCDDTDRRCRFNPRRAHHARLPALHI